MNITSYNIADVGYHYIGLRVLASMPPNMGRDEQITAISRSILKYVNDKALRLMLPQPRGTFETIGEKVAQELIHFDLARNIYGKGYELTEKGIHSVALLNSKQHSELRRLMVQQHFATYENLRTIFKQHLSIGSVYRPIVEANLVGDRIYIEQLLEPSFGETAPEIAEEIWHSTKKMPPKQIEDALRERILAHLFQGSKTSVTVFRAMFERLESMRLLNIAKTFRNKRDFLKTYSPCLLKNPTFEWHVKFSIYCSGSEVFEFYLSDPDVSSQSLQERLLSTIEEAFRTLSTEAGYYDLPEVRDFSCERLLIPEAAFDEGVNTILDRANAPLTVGLRYEGISARRKPLVRTRESTNIYNLIRRG